MRRTLWHYKGLPKLNVAKQLLDLRQKLGLTQDQVGEKLEICQTYAAQIANETVDASARIAGKILEISGKSPAKIASELEKTEEQRPSSANE